MITKLEKSFHKFVEIVETNPLICKTLHFDQYSRLAICFNIFRFSAINSKTNLNRKKCFPLVCRARRDKSIDA